MNYIHVVDDDDKILITIEKLLVSNGFEVVVSSSGNEFLEKAMIFNPAVVLSDINLGYNQIDGEDLLKKIIENYPNTQVIMMSGEAGIQKVLSCIKNGAIDFFEKPVSLARLLTSVRNASATFNLKNKAMEKINILGKSSAMTTVTNKIKKLAKINDSVLIFGESGTGKELVAENLHFYSDRFSYPLYKVNCTSFNKNLIESELFGHKKGSFTGALKDKKGYFEIANKSTLFIDEIGDFELGLQSKILRVLQEKKITAVGDDTERDIKTRMLFATHRDIPMMINEEKFREDLYFRLSTFVLKVPPLRERLEDIDILAPYFLNKFLDENNIEFKKFSEKAIEKLKKYSYPGNIRELIKIVKNAAFFSEEIEICCEDIVFDSNKSKQEDIWNKLEHLNLSESKQYFEKELIIRRLKIYNNDIKKAADSLGMINNNLYRKLKTYGINIK